MTTTPAFALSRILRASGSASTVALPASGVVRPRQLPACLEFDPPHDLFSKLDQQLSRRRNHRSQRSQIALKRRRCRFYESHAVCHIEAGETSRTDKTLADHADARSPNGISSVAPAQTTRRLTKPFRNSRCKITSKSHAKIEVHNQEAS